ncbi:hypothetical protein R69608_01403 [Paraburkholderia nemoris]|nr:hypothetical protein R69608_01403 [Paraburkholderia nemoris]
MYTVTQIKERASTCTVYMLDSKGQSKSVPGIIEQIGQQFVQCLYRNGRYQWYVQAERVNESHVQALLDRHRQ